MSIYPTDLNNYTKNTDSVVEEFSSFIVHEAFKKLSVEDRKAFHSIINKEEVEKNLLNCLGLRNFTNRIRSARIIGCSVTLVALLCSIVASGCLKDISFESHELMFKQVGFCSSELFTFPRRVYWLPLGLLTGLTALVESTFNGAINDAKEQLKLAIAGRKIEQI